MVRYARAASLDAEAVPHPERLERRTRRLARAGALLASVALGWAQRREPAVSERLGEALRDNDVLLTPATPAPPPPVGSCEGRGWVATSALAGAAVAYLTAWNYTGQPACSVPAGLDPDGLPRAVQLVGRSGDERTLLALAAQIESARPWAQERPSQFS